MASEKGKAEQAPFHAIAAEFRSPESVLAGARRLHDLDCGRVDVFSPQPVAGLDEALGLRASPIATLGAFGVMAGFAASMGLCLYATAYDYPFDIGGRPVNSWPAFVVPSASFAILVGAALVYLTMLFLNRLPRLNHPAFNVPGFERVTQDAYFLSIEAGTKPFDADAVERALDALPDRPMNVHRIAR